MRARCRATETGQGKWVAGVRAGAIPGADVEVMAAECIAAG